MDDVEALVRIRDRCRSGVARAARVTNELSLSETGADVGVSPSTIFRWETGVRRPRGEAALRYGALIERLLARPAPTPPTAQRAS